MFDAMRKIAERKIQEAMAAGEFDSLPGKGRPLEAEDDFMVPEDLRLAYRILKNSGFTPPELQVRNEIVRLEDMLPSITDEGEKYRQIKKLNFLVMKLNTMRGGSVRFEESQHYYERIVSRISTAASKESGKPTR